MYIRYLIYHLHPSTAVQTRYTRLKYPTIQIRLTMQFRTLLLFIASLSMVAAVPIPVRPPT